MAGVIFGLGSCLALGCGDSAYRVSGKVTFKGQPIPEGRIFFIPDSSKGNKGPTGSAEIKDGQYDTAGPNGKGSIGGPMMIRIEAWDPSKSPPKVDKSALASKPALFPPYQTSADLPKSDSNKDIDVPADAVKGFQKQGLGSK
jgi:hypothetical protein